MIPMTSPQKKYVCPKITHVMLMKRIPWTQSSWPPAFWVFKIFLALATTENANRTFPEIPKNQRQLFHFCKPTWIEIVDDTKIIVDIRFSFLGIRNIDAFARHMNLIEEQIEYCRYD